MSMHFLVVVAGDLAVSKIARKETRNFGQTSPSVPSLGSISTALSGPVFVPSREETAVISGVSAGSFPETAAGNRAYPLTRSEMTDMSLFMIETRD